MQHGNWLTVTTVTSMVTWSHCDDLVIVTTDPPGCGDCDKCARVAGRIGILGAGGGGGPREMGN